MIRAAAATAARRRCCHGRKVAPVLRMQPLRWISLGPPSSDTPVTGLAARTLLATIPDPDAASGAPPNGTEADAAENARRRRNLGGRSTRKSGSSAGSGGGRLLMLVASLFAGAAYLGRPDGDSQVEGDGLLPVVGGWLDVRQWWRRGRGRMRTTADVFAAPAFEKLLPDPLPAPYQMPYTLLVNLDDTLVHTEWDRLGGWRTARHPQAARFLGYLARHYEVVVFTASQAVTAAPIVDAVDPLGGVMYRLYRDATRFDGNRAVKDLAQLNRDPARVVALDVDAAVYPGHRENLVLLPRWNGDPRDTSLLDMVPFLETLSLSNLPDVRPVLRSYISAETGVAAAFAERQEAFRRNYRSSQYAAPQPGGATSTGSGDSRPNSGKKRGLAGLLGVQQRRQVGPGANSDHAGPKQNAGTAPTLLSHGPSSPSVADLISRQAELMQRQFMAEEKMLRDDAQNQRTEQEKEIQRILGKMKKRTTLWDFWVDTALQMSSIPPDPEMLSAITDSSNPTAAVSN